MRQAVWRSGTRTYYRETERIIVETPLGIFVAVWRTTFSYFLSARRSRTRASVRKSTMFFCRGQWYERRGGQRWPHEVDFNRTPECLERTVARNHYIGLRPMTVEWGGKYKRRRQMQSTRTLSHTWRDLYRSSKMSPHGRCSSRQSLDAICNGAPTSRGQVNIHRPDFSPTRLFVPLNCFL